jgi:hypothetical protein
LPPETVVRASAIEPLDPQFAPSFAAGTALSSTSTPSSTPRDQGRAVFVNARRSQTSALPRFADYASKRLHWRSWSATLGIADLPQGSGEDAITRWLANPRLRGRGVRRRRAKARISAIGLFAGLVLPLTAYADSDPIEAELQALRRELKELAAKDQQQIQALQRQLQALTRKHAVAPTPAVALAAPSPAPPPPPPGTVATFLPGNLPGRSTMPPYTGMGVPPLPSTTVPAEPVSSGGNKLMLSISGQVNRALLWGYDGLASKLHQVDNNNSSTRFRIVGEAMPMEGTIVGLDLETEIRPNSSATQTLTQNLPQPASATTFTIRQAEAYIANPGYGGVRLGFGSTASYLTSEIDLSGTAVASYVQVADFDGGFAFRQRGAAMVPGGARGALVLSPANAYGPAVGSVFNYFDGLGRDDRIRYDTPVWNGFQFATSLVDGNAADVAARYARQFDDFQIVGAIGLATATSRGHSQPGSYGYAGVPAGVGGISLAGTNSAPGSPTVADVSPNGSNQLDGSISVLLKSGLNFTFAGGVRAVHYKDPTGQSLSPNLLDFKLGQQLEIFPVGLTALSIDFVQNKDLIFAGDVARAYGIAAVQNFDQFGLELYLAARYETLERHFASYHSLVAVMSGARVRF